MPKFHSNNDVQIRLDTVWQNITKSDIIFYQKTLKYFNDFQNRNFTVLWTQTMEIKQNQTFFHGANSLWHHLFLLKKYSIISMTFKIKISQFYDHIEPKQWKWNKIRHFFMRNIQIWHYFSLVTKYSNI